MKRSNITRKDLANAIHEKMGFSLRSAEDIVNELFAQLKEGLIDDRTIKLIHFGTLSIRKKSPRMGRNPRTGEAMEITKRGMVSFRPSKSLRERIND